MAVETVHGEDNVKEVEERRVSMPSLPLSLTADERTVNRVTPRQ